MIAKDKTNNSSEQENKLTSQAIGPAIFSLQNQNFELHPFKAIYWKEEAALIISDLHLGKAAHFTKAGIPIPAKALTQKNLGRLKELIQLYTPKQVLLLGDLFHSKYNASWEDFCDFTKSNSDINFLLIEGNHDFLSSDKYEAAGLQVISELVMGPFIFTHEPLEKEYHLYNLSGHIHPGVRLQGPAKQGGRFPCFYFGAKQGLLPAFGAFTGLAIIQPEKKDRVFIIFDSEVCEMG